MSLRYGFAALALAASSMLPAQTLNCADVSGLTPNEKVRFDQDVLPIIEDDLLQCTSCHGGAGSLALDRGEATHDELFCVDTQSSVPQPAAKRIVPGAPMESWFYLRIACDDPNDPGFRMPRNQWLLTTSEIRLIYDWIVQGAFAPQTLFTSRFDNRGYCP